MSQTALRISEGFDFRESDVRSYSRSFPVQFDRARGAEIFDSSGRRYIDFLSGCGSLNYGHNHPVLKDALLSFIQDDGVAMGLDLSTGAKTLFMAAFQQHILAPRGLDYVLQFPGPTGTNAIEAALKLARRVTGRSAIYAFTNGFHGMTMGALACTGSAYHRVSTPVGAQDVVRVPYDGYFGTTVDTIDMIEALLSDPSSGFDPPAAFLVEVLQGEGGVNAARKDWVERLGRLARSKGALLIVDDIQAGCGRTGTFFSFEGFDLDPDIVVLSKSISGYGIPLAIVLLKPEHDVWQPGQHNGTFRGNSHAFVTGARALEEFWSGRSDSAADFDALLAANIDSLDQFVVEMCHVHSCCRPKGRGLMRGLLFADPMMAERVRRQAFADGLIIELAGPRDEVLKFMPPLNIEPGILNEGLQMMRTIINVEM